jgi:hypothetical protein
VGPVFVVRPAIIGAGGIYVKKSAVPVGLVPLGVTTVILTVPTEPAGDVAYIKVSFATLNDAAGVEPKYTCVAPVKPVP